LVDVDATANCNSAGCWFVDRGTGAAPVASVVPYVQGSLGIWSETLSLPSPRAWGALANSPDPNSITLHYLYAFGGITGTGSGDSGASNTFDRATITITIPTNPKGREAQSLSAWALGGTAMSSARYNLMATTMDPSVAPNIPGLPRGSFYIHVGPGNAAGGNAVNDIDLANVPAGGVISLQATNGASPGSRQGACMFPYTTLVGELGFIGGDNSDRGTAGKLNGFAGCTGVNCLVTFGNWNAGWGVTPQNPRDVKCIKVKPFVFLAGGVVNGNPTSFTAFNYV